ncbi:C-type lectin domain family 4 member M-like isoform X1 [Oncorhynchus tshawytscha]|nr:C-type lectin domain family 4 member M-like isoform X1 [Oncorhynchus tshawytscha]
MSEGVYENSDGFEDNKPDVMKNTDIDDQLYGNVGAFKPSRSDGVVASVHFQWWKRPSGVAAVCLGLLCVLLLAGIIGLAVYYGVIGHHYSTERDQLQASYNTLTKERDQLQTSYTNMTEESTQLQTSYNTLTKERDQLQTSCNNMTEERNQLQTRYNTLTKERDQLQTSYTNMTEESTQLQTSYNTLTKERDQLQTSCNNMTEERNQLQTRYNTLTKERDQLQTSCINITEERNQLKTSYNNMIEERDQLQIRVRFYEKPCLAGWWKFGTSCYYVSSTMNSSGAGQRECRTMGGELVVINSREEQIFIYEFKKNVWIGTFFKAKIWKWVDNTPFATTYWMEGEPNNFNDKGVCVEISQTATDPLKSWRDGPCVPKHWVCEKPITP